MNQNGRKDEKSATISFPGGHHPEAHISEEDRRDRERMASEGGMSHVRPPDPSKSAARKKKPKAARKR